MSIPIRRKQLERVWSGEGGNLESRLLVVDFFRFEEGYNPAQPLLIKADHGLMQMFTMEGLDPEPLDSNALAAASAAIARAMDALNPAQLGDWTGGTWQVQNCFTRRVGLAPSVARLKTGPEGLMALARSCDEAWRRRLVFNADEITWTIEFLPRFRDSRPTWLRTPWELVEVDGKKVAIEVELARRQAQMFRRVMKVVEEHLAGFVARRPRMGFGFRPLSEQETFAALWRQVNRRAGDPGLLRRDLSLITQVAASERDDTGREYRINGRLTRVLTWKNPPSGSVANLFARVQEELRFPVTVAQTFRTRNQQRMLRRVTELRQVAAALAGRQEKSAEYFDESEAFLERVGGGGELPWDWNFVVLVDGTDEAELEDRVARLSSQLQAAQASEDVSAVAGELLEERDTRMLAEVASLPGNGQFCLREHIVTSRNLGDLAFAYRLSRGDANPSLILGDRQGGAFGYDPFSRREVNNNKAVLGGSGAGKSFLLNSMVPGLALRDAQVYVIDRGNSFGPPFEMLMRDSPDDVAVMRLQSSDFRFNPCNFVWAIEERERQKGDGTYRMQLEGGEFLPCPMETERRLFENLIDCIVSQGRPLTPEGKNRLDKALKGKLGEGGFFRAFENQCGAYLQEHRAGGGVTLPPRPLSSLLQFLRCEAEEFVDAVELWTRKPRAQYFDSGTDSLASARYVYFELTGLNDDPFLALPFVGALVGSIWKRIQDPRHVRQRKAVIIDEAWSFLGHPAFFGLTEEMFRTIRKFNGFVMVSSQSPNDVKNGNARMLLQNMAEVFLYKGFSEPDFLANDLHLEPHHCRLQESLREDDQRRELYYVSVNKGHNRVLSVEIPPTLYWYATTDADDKHWRNVFCHELGLVEGVKALAEACGNVTIANGALRLRKVAAYAKGRGFVREGDKGAA
jgi:hypothetical protein